MSGFPVMVRWREDLYVAHRRDDAIRLMRLPIESLPRTAGLAEPEPTPTVRIGDMLPTALVETTEGELDLAEGGASVIAFYARWCQPCREELRMLEALRRESVSIVAVSVDEGSLERAERVARAWGFEGAVVRDVSAADALGVPPLPAVFVVDVEGRVVMVESGRVAELAALRAALH